MWATTWACPHFHVVDVTVERLVHSENELRHSKKSLLQVFQNGMCRYGPQGIGGEGGIRTPDTVARMPHFECGAFNHSATSPSL